MRGRRSPGREEMMLGVIRILVSRVTPAATDPNPTSRDTREPLARETLHRSDTAEVGAKVSSKQDGTARADREKSAKTRVRLAPDLSRLRSGFIAKRVALLDRRSYFNRKEDDLW